MTHPARAPIETRVLGAGDEKRLEEFLEAHANSSMILRSNLRTAGIVDRGQPFQATYAAALEGDRVVAVAAHMSRGQIALQAPEHVEAVVRLAAERSGRAIGGFIGPWAQVAAAREALGLGEHPTRLMSREILYALPLGDLVVPPMLASGAVRCRRPEDADMPLLSEWRNGYNVEASGMAEGPETTAQSQRDVEHWRAARASFVLTRDGEPVAYSAFNATIPDTVQVGGVWTPPALRARGYGRCVVAGSLVMAREEGAGRALLFTGDDNLPAQRAYEALGFRPIGDYGLIRFAEPAR